MNKKILIIGFKYHHHSNFSGYDRVVDYLNKKLSFKYLNIYKLILVKNSSNRIYNLLHRLNHRLVLLLFKYVYSYICKEYDLVHFLYPEDLVSKINLSKNHKQIILASFHQPPSWFESLDTRKRANLSIIDVAICLGTNQISSIKQNLNINNILYLPHGVDCRYFVSHESVRKRNRILIVGSWMRDFDFLEKIISLFDKKYSQIQFDLVIGLSSKKRLNKYNNVKIHSNISNNELLFLYNTSTLVLFALKDAVANNALLESMATENTIIVNDVGSIRDYFNDNAGLIVDKNIMAFEKAIIDVVSDVSITKKYRDYLEEHSKVFCWHNIAEQLFKIYEKY